MQWIHEYDLFLLDFDGLLVNTEEIHYRAYERMLENRGLSYGLSFQDYSKLAHYSSDGLKKDIYSRFPHLTTEKIQWDLLYLEKTNSYLDLIHEGAVQLMPGVDLFLQTLSKWNKRACVVTHSKKELVTAIRKQNEPLNSIQNWITRDDYNNPKPDAECYLVAIERYGKEAERIIGFEDTPRGLTALMGTRADSVLVTSFDYPEIGEFVSRGARHFRTFVDLLATLS